MPVSLEHLRHVDPQTRILVGYRLDVTAAESPRLRRRLALRLEAGPRYKLKRCPFRTFREDTGVLVGSFRPPRIQTAPDNPSPDVSN